MSKMTYKVYLRPDNYQDDGWALTFVRIDNDRYDYLASAAEREEAILLQTVEVEAPTTTDICSLGGKAAEAMREAAAKRYKEAMGEAADFEAKFLLLSND